MAHKRIESAYGPCILITDGEYRTLKLNRNQAPVVHVKVADAIYHFAATDPSTGKSVNVLLTHDDMLALFETFLESVAWTADLSGEIL